MNTDATLITAFQGWTVGDARSLTVRERRFYVELAAWRRAQEEAELNG